MKCKVLATVGVSHCDRIALMLVLVEVSNSYFHGYQVAKTQSAFKFDILGTMLIHMNTLSRQLLNDKIDTTILSVHETTKYNMTASSLLP